MIMFYLSATCLKLIICKLQHGFDADPACMLIIYQFDFTDITKFCLQYCANLPQVKTLL